MKKLSANKRAAFVHAFNSAMEQHHDEGKAFAIAHAAANRAGESEEEMDTPELQEAELDTKARNALDDSDFAYIDPDGGRHFPIHDEAHVRNALARLSQSPHGSKARAKVMAAAKKFGIKVSEEGERPLKTRLLQEAIDLSDAKVDAETRTVEVTLIRPGWSTNKRYYSKEVLAASVPAFEGIKAYTNHPSKSDERDRPERDVRDIAGYYEGVRQESDGRLVATMRVVGKAGEEVWPLIQEAVTRKPDFIGTSIFAAGKVREGEADGQKGAIVEEITKARSNSVDIVTVPAAGGRFERLAAADDLFSELLGEIDFEEWRDARPDFVKRLREELKSARQTEAVEQRDAEITQLREATAAKDERLREQEMELSSLRQEKTLHEAEVLALAKLDESGLPTVIWEHVKPDLLGKTAEDMDRILEREIAKLKATGALKPKAKGLGQGGDVEEQVQGEKQAALNKALGLSEAVSPVRAGEDVWEYKRRLQEQQKNDGKDAKEA